MERFKLEVDVEQSPFGDFRLTRLDGPVADKMLCYAMLGGARDGVKDLEPIDKAGDAFRLVIEICRKPDGTFRLERLRGPGADVLFVYGMLEVARDGVRAGIGGAHKLGLM